MPKHEFVYSADYVWVTFRDNRAPEECLKIFKHETFSKKMCKKICCIDTSQEDQA